VLIGRRRFAGRDLSSSQVAGSGQSDNERARAGLGGRESGAAVGDRRPNGGNEEGSVAESTLVVGVRAA